MHGLNFDIFNTLLITPILMVILLGGPLTLYAIIKLLNSYLNSPKATIVKLKENNGLGLLVKWDWEDNDDIKVARVRLDINEFVPGGRSKSLSFTFEDKNAKKKSFLIPLKLDEADFKFITDAGVVGKKSALKNTKIDFEIECTSSETFRTQTSKASLQSKLLDPFVADPQEVEVLPPTQADTWSVLTRVFPWKKAAVMAALAAENAGPEGDKPKAAKSNEPKAPSLVDFLVTKVWIEPGCIVCDACENEAPQVFKVLADTCIVVENANLSDGGSIKAAAEGCPVNVIKFTTTPKAATG